MAGQAVEYRNDRTRATVALARSAFEAGAYQRSLDLLAEADGLEAWAGAKCGTGSRGVIGATITGVRRALTGGGK